MKYLKRSVAIFIKQKAIGPCFRSLIEIIYTIIVQVAAKLPEVKFEVQKKDEKETVDIGKRSNKFYFFLTSNFDLWQFYILCTLAIFDNVYVFILKVSKNN